MVPQSGSHGADIEAISGICGSISIACWVVVFSPQIIENFRKSSAQGLSVEFIIIWLAGDIFNILGAVLQGLLTTMIILAVYYALADIVLLGQYFYYMGFRLTDPKPIKSNDTEDVVPSERSPLIINGHANGHANGSAVPPSLPPNAADIENRPRSRSAFRERLTSLDARASPAVPIHTQAKDATAAEALKSHQPRSWTQAIMFNSTAITLVILAGVAGYYLTPATPEHKRPRYPAEEQEDFLQFSLWGQIFGYICAVLYLGSRVPQLLLNYRRKSTDGLNALFFLFACIGNLTYVCSILAFEPICSHRRHGHWQESSCRTGEAPRIYARYILVNLSWLIGSLGTFVLDLAVFIQFWIYRKDPLDGSDSAITTTAAADEDRGHETNGR